jgi:hypothetical protein
MTGRYALITALKSCCGLATCLLRVPALPSSHGALTEWLEFSKPKITCDASTWDRLNMAAL